MKKIFSYLSVILFAFIMIFSISCNEQKPVATSIPDPCENGHTLVTDEEVTPTCTEKGLSEGAHCSLCGTIISKQESVAALGHQEGSWIIVEDPTCTEVGKRKKICSVCNETTVTENIEALCISSQNVTIDLNEYTIIYSDVDKSNTFHVSQITRLASIIKSEANIDITPVAESTATVLDKEILIGLTSRPESKVALDSIHGMGFTIRVMGDKIVLVGTDDTMTLAAVNYFISNHLSGIKSSTIDIITKYTLCNSKSIVFANSSGTDFVYVIDEDLDRNPKNMFINGKTDLMDYPYSLVKNLISKVAVLSRSNENDHKIITDIDNTHIDGYEVQFGEIDRIESKNFRLNLDVNEYGYFITDKKIIITAHNDIGLENAKNYFLEFYKYLIKYNNGEFPIGYQYKGFITDQGWEMDFPRPQNENITVESSQHNNNKSIQIIYTGSGVSVESYIEYCKLLEASGYVIVTQNDNPGNTGSYFRTYKNEQTQHVLYVAFNAFKYKEVYKNPDRASDHVLSDILNNMVVNYPMRDYDPCIRVVSASLDNAYLPSDEILQDTYDRNSEKTTESSITAMRYYSQSVGMGYIIQLEDGSFFIIDGGNTSNDDPRVLYNVLSELYKKSHGGNTPSQSNPIHIKAWLITHSHADHFQVAVKFMEQYGKIDKLISVDYLIGNFPEKSSVYSVSGDILNMGKIDQIQKMQSYVPGGFDYIKVHTGQVLYFANLKLEVLMTTEDHAPFRINVANDTNTVTKLTIRSENKDTTWMVLGDSCLYQSRWLCAMWGGDSYNESTDLYDNSYLRSDMVQLAHHGNIGCEIALYKTIQGEVLWFPHNSDAYNSYVFNRPTSEWRVQVDRYVAKTLSTIKYIIVSGWYNNSTEFKNYHDSITLEFTADGPNYNDIWGVNYRKNNSSVVSQISFNSSTGKIVNSPVIKK